MSNQSHYELQSICSIQPHDIYHLVLVGLLRFLLCNASQITIMLSGGFPVPRSV